MGNWCINEIEIQGEKLHLKKLNKKINDYINLSKKGNKIFFMEYLIGLGKVPADYNENVGEFKKEWFGTRCDIGLFELEFKMMDESIHIVADSRWYPILPFVSKLCKKYKVTSIMEYYEYQGDFGGRAIIDNSGNVNDSVHPYLEALFLYENKQFWIVLEDHIKYIIPEYFEEFIRDQTYLGKKDKITVEVLLHAKEHNLLT